VSDELGEVVDPWGENRSSHSAWRSLMSCEKVAIRSRLLVGFDLEGVGQGMGLGG